MPVRSFSAHLLDSSITLKSPRTPAPQKGKQRLMGAEARSPAWASPYLSGITVEVGEALLTALDDKEAASFRSLCLQPGILPPAPRLP